MVVSEGSLTQALMKARRIVGDDGDRQTVIRTVQRRGFRFVAQLEAPAAEEPRAMQPTPTPLGAATAATTERPVSVAVLAFVDMSASRDQEHFCDGMAEEIINALVRVEGCAWRHARPALLSSTGMRMFARSRRSWECLPLWRAAFGAAMIACVSWHS